MNYLREQDLYGILFKDVVNQYIVVENNNLKEFAAKLGVENIDKIPDKIEFDKITNYLNDEKIGNICDKYLNIAIQAIPEEKYSNIEKEKISLGDDTIEADGYMIKLNIRDIQSISKQILENAKDDEQIFNLIKKDNMTFENYQDTVQEILDTMSQEIDEEQNVDILTLAVYKQGKHTVKFSVKLPAEAAEEETNKMEISLEKTSKGMSLKYDFLTTTISGTNENKITITRTKNSAEQETIEGIMTQLVNGEEQSNFNMNINRNGDYTSNNISFEISLFAKNSLLSEDASFIISLSNTSNFSATLQSEEFTEGNHLVINDLSQEQITNLFTNLGKLLSEKLKDEMFVSYRSSNMMGLYETARQAADETERASEQEQALMEQMQGTLQSSENQPYQYSNLITVGPTDVNN